MTRDSLIENVHGGDRSSMFPYSSPPSLLQSTNFFSEDTDLIDPVGFHRHS